MAASGCTVTWLNFTSTDFHRADRRLSQGQTSTTLGPTAVLPSALVTCTCACMVMELRSRKRSSVELNTNS